MEGDDSDADNNDHSGHSGAPRSLRKSAVSRKSVVGAGGLRRPSNRYKAGDGAAVPLIAEDDLSGEGAGSGDAEAVRVRVDGEENGDDEDENEDDDDDDEDDDAPKKGCCARCIVQ